LEELSVVEADSDSLLLLLSLEEGVGVAEVERLPLLETDSLQLALLLAEGVAESV
jgi:hypothetical protein